MVNRAYIPNFKSIGQYFKMGGVGGDSPPPQGGNGGEFRKNRQNSSSSNVLENVHTKFQDNLIKFRDFVILGGEVPPWGGRMGGNFKILKRVFIK